MAEVIRSEKNAAVQTADVIRLKETLVVQTAYCGLYSV